MSCFAAYYTAKLMKARYNKSPRVSQGNFQLGTVLVWFHCIDCRRFLVVFFHNQEFCRLYFVVLTFLSIPTANVSCRFSTRTFCWKHWANWYLSDGPFRLGSDSGLLLHSFPQNLPLLISPPSILWIFLTATFGDSWNLSKFLLERSQKIGLLSHIF